jgi:6-phosphogluconolactonase
MNIEVLADPDAIAHEAARRIADHARLAVAERGRFVLALSRSRTPRMMLRLLTVEQMPWDKVHIAQVDERVAPAGDPERNLTYLVETLLEHAPLHPQQIHAMPVELATLDEAAERYAATLRELAGVPPIIDLVHLGLGADGHTASLVPGDPVLDVADRDVAPTGLYEGRRRITLTYPAINRARHILFVVVGSEKAPLLPRLRDADPSIPAGRIRQDRAAILADQAAAANL